MERISVVGISGAGKSTLASLLAEALDVPVLEIDAVHHQAGWTPLPYDQLAQEVRAFTSFERWIVDGNYSRVRDEIVWPRADTVVWVDPPRSVVMRQVIWRSVRRVVGRRELWNGNREQLRSLLSWDPERSVIRWAWTRYHPRRQELHDAMASPQWRHLTFVRLATRSDIEAFLRGVDRPRRS